MKGVQGASPVNFFISLTEVDRCRPFILRPVSAFLTARGDDEQGQMPHVPHKDRRQGPRGVQQQDQGRMAAGAEAHDEEPPGETKGERHFIDLATSHERVEVVV